MLLFQQNRDQRNVAQECLRVLTDLDQRFLFCSRWLICISAGPETHERQPTIASKTKDCDNLHVVEGVYKNSHYSYIQARLLLFDAL